MLDLSTLTSAGLLSAGFLTTAAMVHRWSPRERRRLRMLTLFWVAYIVLLGISRGATVLGLPGLAAGTGDASLFIGWITIIQIAALMLFRLVLPRLGTELPSIVADLFIGAGFLVLILGSLRHYGVDPTSILATSAVVTGILALSLQPTLGNVIGGVALQLDRSVRVGDWLELDGGRQGRVREIRWRHTVIETRDWDTVIVPNSSLLAANILILGKRHDEPVQHRQWVRFNVDFRYRPTHVIRVVEEALRAPPLMPGVAERPPPDCVCLDLAAQGRESYGVYAVRYWLTDLQRDDPTSSIVRQRLYAALQRAEIPLAIPAAQFFVEQDDTARREEKRQREMQRRLDALRAVEFLKVLRSDELEQVANSLRPALFSPGETIMQQGDRADWLYIMTEGQVEVWVSDGEQSERVAMLKAPTLFGEMGLMTGEPRTATIIAIDAVSCFKLFREDFGKILADRPQIAEEVSAILAARGAQLLHAQHDLDARDHKRPAPPSAQGLLTRIQSFFGLSD